MKCPKCNAENQDDSKLCVKCGAELQAEPAVAEPAPESAPAAEQTVAQPVVAEQQKGWDWKRIVLLVGSICGALAMLFSFVFMFLIGVSSYSTIGEGVETTTKGIGYFFGGSFDELKDVFEKFGEENLDINIADMMHTLFVSMFGSLILVGFLIAMLVVFIKGLIRYIKHFKGTDTKGVVKLTTGAYGLYALCAGLIYILFVWDVSGEGESIGMGYSGATVAGLVLGGVCLGLFLVSRLVVEGKSLLQKNVLVPSILTVCAVALAAVVCGLSVYPLVSVAEDGETMSYSFISFIKGLQLNKSLLEMDDAPEYVVNSLTAMGYGIGGWVIQIVTLSLAFSLLIKTLRDVARKEPVGGLGIAIALVIFSLVTLVVTTMLLGEDYKAVIFGSGEAPSNLAPSVCLVVMSVLSLGILIAQKVVGAKMKKAEDSAPQA